MSALVLALAVGGTPSIVIAAAPERLAASSSVLTRAVETLRSEQRAALAQASRQRLAELRSEVATAMAQGAVASPAPAVKTAP